MAAFDQMRLYLKKYQLCTLLILKRIKFAKQRRKRICWIRKIRSSRFANFTGEYLCWSLFFNKVAGPSTLLKETPTQVFSYENCEVFKSTCFTEHLQWLLLENLFRSSTEMRLHITDKIYTVI